MSLPKALLTGELYDQFEDFEEDGKPLHIQFAPEASMFRLQGQPLKVESVAWPLVLCSILNPRGEYTGSCLTIDCRRTELVPLPKHFMSRLRRLYAKKPKLRSLPPEQPTQPPLTAHLLLDGGVPISQRVTLADSIDDMMDSLGEMLDALDPPTNSSDEPPYPLVE